MEEFNGTENFDPMPGDICKNIKDGKLYEICAITEDLPYTREPPLFLGWVIYKPYEEDNNAQQYSGIEDGPRIELSHNDHNYFYEKYNGLSLLCMTYRSFIGKKPNGEMGGGKRFVLVKKAPSLKREKEEIGSSIGYPPYEGDCSRWKEDLDRREKMLNRLERLTFQDTESTERIDY